MFYVGMTRAKEELIITYAKDPSPFLAELDEKSVKRERAGREKKTETGVQMSLFDFLP